MPHIQFFGIFLNVSKDVIFKSPEKDAAGLLAEFFETFPQYSSDDSKKKITDSWDFLLKKSDGLLRSCGKPYYLHPVRIAFILAQDEFDSDCIAAGILHSTPTLGATHEELEKIAGTDVATIIDGISRITNVQIKSKTLQQADAIRKMLFAMVDDVRVIFVKIADRLDRIRNIKNVEKPKQRQIAAEALDIWAPLADRLGMSNIKNEFEDLSLKYSNPDAFQQIKSVINLKKEERSEYLNNAVNKIQTEAEKIGIKVTITSRAKHFYSIYQKMRKRNKEPGELFDLLALRIICQKNQECYTLVGIVHSLWKPLEGRFKDYIAMPKSNGYQSLHTTVMCEDRPLEIQIRTQKMHDIAERGVASHWLYKKGKSHDLVDSSQLTIFNQLQELRDKQVTNENFFASLKSDLLGDEIYVFTPNGDVKHLPEGSTAIDFAYSIHSGIGEKIIGAKADGKIIPITQKLKNTQIIEILTNPQAHPTENQLKFAKTSKARQKIHAWLVANDPNFVDKIATEKLEAAKAEHEAQSHAIQDEKRKGHKKGTGPNEAPRNITKVKVAGSSNFIYNFAQCCRPAFPNPIVGYVSVSNGVMIHRADCLTYLRIPNHEKKTVPVEWDET